MEKVKHSMRSTSARLCFTVCVTIINKKRATTFEQDTFQYLKDIVKNTQNAIMASPQGSKSPKKIAKQKTKRRKVTEA
jgi:hypothetical protein